MYSIKEWIANWYTYTHIHVHVQVIVGMWPQVVCLSDVHVQHIHRPIFLFCSFSLFFYFDPSLFYHLPLSLSPPLSPSLSLSPSPSLSGRLPVRNGIFTDHSYPIDMAFRVFLPSNTGGLPSDEVTIPQVLKQGGYNSALVKTHACACNCLVCTCTCILNAIMPVKS